MRFCWFILVFYYIFQKQSRRLSKLCADITWKSMIHICQWRKDSFIIKQLNACNVRLSAGNDHDRLQIFRICKKKSSIYLDIMRTFAWSNAINKNIQWIQSAIGICPLKLISADSMNKNINSLSLPPFNSI